MVRVILHGCNGQMGRVITALAEEDREITIVAGIDVTDEGKNPYPVYRNLQTCSISADVVVDFSVAAAMNSLLDGIEEKKIPAVVCTTGLTEEQLGRLVKLVKDAARVLAPADFDMEVVEKHHRRKLDAPSGTALALADSMNEALNNEYHYTYDRSERRARRDPKEIGISAVRGGNIVGQHDVIFAGTDEVVTLQHTAYSRAIFGKGALAAARFLAGKSAGFYTMQDVIAE